MRLIALYLSPVFALVIGPLIVLASAPASGGGPEGGPMLVLSGWGAGAERRIGQAGGQVIGPLRAPLGMLATSDNPAFADNLRAAGAWAVLDGSRIAALCGADT